MRPWIALAWIALVAACKPSPSPLVRAPSGPRPTPASAVASGPAATVVSASPAPASECPLGSRPSPEGPVTLTVVDLLGRSLAGAGVAASVDVDGGEARQETFVADAGGRVTVPARARLIVSAPGFVTLGRLVAREIAPPRIHLLPASTIAGRVLEAGSRLPLAGVDLVVVKHRDSTVEGRATTEADGRFRVTGLVPGRYHVVAEDDRRSGQRGVAVGLGETVGDVEVGLHRLVRVEGRLRAANGRTCTSGHVTLHVGDPAAGGHGCTCAGGPDTVTAALDPKTGVARFLLAPDQTYGVEAYCAGHLIGTHAPIVVRRRDIGGLVWRARRGLTVRGRVVDEDGKPLAGVDVGARYDPESMYYDQVARGEARTDANGEFTLSGLAPGAPELFVDGDSDRGWYFGEAEVELDEGDLSGLEITAEFHEDERDDEDSSERCLPEPPSLPELRGVVVDAGGAPVPNAVVVRYIGGRSTGALGALSYWSGDAPVLTDDHGEFHLPFDLEERECKGGGRCRDALVAYRIGGGEGSVATPALDEAAQIRIGPRATITGAVKSARGRPVTSFGVTLDQNSIYPPIDYQYDPAGAFELPGILPGNYHLGLHTPGGDLGRWIAVDAGQRVHIDLVVAPEREQRGDGE